MKRRLRFAKLASYLAVGGLLLQLSGCLTMAETVGLASFDISQITDSQGRLFGLFAVCGQPNVLVLDEDGVPQEVLFTEDDLVFNCPISSTVVETTGGGTGGGSGT